MDKFLNTSDNGAMTALQTINVSHCEYADDIASNTAHHLQLQLDRFHTYTTLKGLTLNGHKTKTMAFFCSNPPVFCYSGTPLEDVHRFRYLGTSLHWATLGRCGKMTNASNQMAHNYAGAIVRVWMICSELGIKNRKHVMLWIFLCTLCRPIWMSSLGYKHSHIKIFCYNQRPHRPRLLSKDAVGCKTKHKYILPVLLDCPSADLANTWVKHHHLSCSPSCSSNRLRDFFSLALYVHECIECCA